MNDTGGPSRLAPGPETLGTSAPVPVPVHHRADGHVPWKTVTVGLLVGGSKFLDKVALKMSIAKGCKSLTAGLNGNIYIYII